MAVTKQQRNDFAHAVLKNDSDYVVYALSNVTTDERQGLLSMDR